MKRGPKRGSHQQNGRVHDGYALTGSNYGGWSFVEGRKPPDKEWWTAHDDRALRDCLKRRGIN